MKKFTLLLLAIFSFNIFIANALDHPKDVVKNQTTNSNTSNKATRNSPWLVQNTGFNNPSRGINQIAIVNAKTVWAKAYDGSGLGANVFEFTRTTNGGSTWKHGFFTANNMQTLYKGCGNLSPINDTICYASLFPADAQPHGGSVIKTTDGGKTWIEQSVSFSTSWLDWVVFFDANNGICLGDPNASHQFIAYTTTDGGSNWIPVSSLINDASLIAQTTEYGTVGYVDHVGNTIWFGTSKGRVYKSTDKGINWTVTSTGFPIETDIRFQDTLIGIAFNYKTTTSAYAAKKTTDGGATWNTLNPTGAFRQFFIAPVPGSTNVWANVSPDTSRCGSAYSTDACESFVSVDAGSAYTGAFQYTSVSFFDNHTGWAGGFNMDSLNYGIFRWDSTLTFGTGFGVNEKKLNQLNINIYPNPSNSGLFNIDFENSNSEKPLVEVFDIIGNKVFDTELNVISNNVYQINLSNNNSGIYFVKITSNSNTYSRKISYIK